MLQGKRKLKKKYTSIKIDKNNYHNHQVTLIESDNEETKTLVSSGSVYGDTQVYIYDEENELMTQNEHMIEKF